MTRIRHGVWGLMLGVLKRLCKGLGGQLAEGRVEEEGVEREGPAQRRQECEAAGSEEAGRCSAGQGAPRKNPQPP